MSIAVVTAAYQAEHTLDAALASVATQTLPATEVVVVDDGSTDATRDVVKRWEPRLPIVLVGTGANRGPAAARAAGIAASSSDLIALLDADDAFLTDHLSLMRAVHERTDDGLVSADTLRWIPGRTLSATPLSAMAPVPPPREQLLWLLAGNHLSVAALFSRARYESVGGFRHWLHGTEDWDLWIRMVRAGAEVARPTEPTVLYRLSANSVSSEDRMVEAKLQVLDAARREGAPHEQRAILDAQRRLRSARHLQDAYRLAHEGRIVTARVEAIRALRGGRSVAARGAAMTLAPRAVARHRERVRFQPAVWLRRYSP